MLKYSILGSRWTEKHLVNNYSMRCPALIGCVQNIRFLTVVGENWRFTGHNSVQSRWCGNQYPAGSALHINAFKQTILRLFYLALWVYWNMCELLGLSTVKNIHVFVKTIKQKEMRLHVNNFTENSWETVLPYQWNTLLIISAVGT